MADVGATTLTNTVRKAAHPLAGAAHDYDPGHFATIDFTHVCSGQWDDFAAWQTGDTALPCA